MQKKAVPCAVLLIENMRSGEGGKVGAQIFSILKISARPSWAGYTHVKERRVIVFRSQK